MGTSSALRKSRPGPDSTDDGHHRDVPATPIRRPPPGPLPGAVLGVGAGALLGWIRTFGNVDVTTAVAAVFVGLVAAVLAGAPAWRPFAGAMLALAALTFAGLLVLWH
jgi:hypothetical protein